MTPEIFQQHYDLAKRAVEDALTGTLAARHWPGPLREAVEYSLLAGGKRLRPILVLKATEVCGESHADAMAAACAIEMVHTYSLIHDDLPSMDDDDLRRGRPTSHRVFGEALAILAGDALLTLAFEMLSEIPSSAQITADCLTILARAAGGSGMVGGQILDLEAERGSFPTLQGANPRTADSNSRAEFSDSAVLDEESAVEDSIPTSNNQTLHVEQLVRIHRMKTGALMTAALELGAACANASAEQRRRLRIYGECTGLAFQIADDLLDVTGAEEKLGKETGRDFELGKLTYPSLIGIEASQQKAVSLVERACEALDIFDDRADFLRQLARFIVERDH
ncbi:MAG: polyprenyl synthetase family protein [Planctomycetaceae bacterium]